MACPYFEPAERLANAEPARLPLGDPYQGVCKADPSPVVPSEAVLKDLCNLGYARGRCSRFPDGAGADAVRFSVAKDENGLIHLCYVLERDHHPFAHGVLSYAAGDGSFAGPAVAALLQTQARAYVESYLRRKQKLNCETRQTGSRVSL